MLVFSAIGMAGFFVWIVAWLYGDFHRGPVTDAEPGWFSTRVVAMFVTAFGAAGAIACSNGVNAALSAVIGLMAGNAAGFVALRIVRYFHRRDAVLAEQHKSDDDPS